MHATRFLAAMALCAIAISVSSNALGGGADIRYNGLGGGVSTFGPVSGIYAYALGSNTCNVGDTYLQWNSATAPRTPGLAMNAYRLFNGRLEQIGVGLVKTACCVGNTPSCGASGCSGPGNTLNAGCMDTYTSGWNSLIDRLEPRSTINAYSGSFGSIPTFTGNATIGRRVQVLQSDMDPAAYPNALYFVEGQYVCMEDAQNGNWTNNASYSRVTVSPAYQYSATGTFYLRVPESMPGRIMAMDRA